MGRRKTKRSLSETGKTGCFIPLFFHRGLLLAVVTIMISLILWKTKEVITTAMTKSEVGCYKYDWL